MFTSEAARQWARRDPKSGLMSQYHRHLASAQMCPSSGRQSQLERCCWQLLLSKLPRTLDREFCAPSKGTSPTAWQHRYSYAVHSAPSSDSHKATSDVVQLLGHVENCFKLRLLWRHCTNGTSSGQIPDSREITAHARAVGADECCTSLLWLLCLFLTLACCKISPNCCKINGIASGHIRFPYISTM